MAKTNITQYDSTPSNNADINSINIAENCPASNINNAIRELMAHLKNMDTGSQALTSPSFTAMSTDTINEKTSTNGVAIDSVTLKDGELGTTASPVPINSSSLNGGQFGGRRNIIINGSAIVAQRGTSSTGLGGSAGVFVCDRWRGGFTMNTGRYTMSQDSNAPTGFAKSVKIDVTTAESSLNVASTMCLGHIIEGQDLQQLKKGTSSAESVTVSFYVKSTTTGTYILEMFDFDNSRILNKSYTINSADTWEFKSITFEGDTSGTLDNDNSASMLLNFCLASGTNRTSGTLGTTWASSVDANRFVGQTNLFASTSNDWAITGLQMEVGSVATPFEHRSFGEELSLCQRYFAKEDGISMRNFTGSSIAVSIPHFWKTTMRVAPSITGTNATANETINTQGFQAYKGGIASGASWQLTGINADAEL